MSSTAGPVRFGTDGVRGRANVDLTAEMALAIGRACVRVFASPKVMLGRDTRVSGPLFESAIAAGVCSEGADAVALGVVPTPTVAAGSARDGVPGVVISASHNPFADNGIKIFAPGGRKLTDAEQHGVEDAIAAVLDGDRHEGPSGAGIGSIVTDPTVVDSYADLVIGAMEGRTLAGLKVVVDCANGAASTIGPEILRRLGADITVIADRPDGRNINERCGSTHPQELQTAVVARGADLGVAFDGDADRVLAVDGRGDLVDGDQIIALCATDLQERGQLAQDTVVVTVMTNLGFRNEMAKRGVTVVDTAVGDRYVLEALAAGGYTLGGEQSGHIIFPAHGTTGDGILSAVVLADLVVRAGRPLAELTAGSMVRLPQVLMNVSVSRPMPDVAHRLAGEIASVETELAGSGRVLLRPSGTEAVVRVMAEAPTEAEADRAARRLAAAVERLTATS